MMNLYLSLLSISCLLGWAGGNRNDVKDAAAPILIQQRQKLTRHVLGPSGSTGLLSMWKPWSKDQKLKVLYGIFTSPLPKYAEQLQAVEETWAKQVLPQRLLVVGVNGSNPDITYKQAPLCQDEGRGAGISCKEATLLSTGYELGADWVVVLGSDNYVFPKRFDGLLEHTDKKIPQILAIYGCGEGKYCEDHKSGICGGGGYAISRAALDTMVGKGVGAAKNFIHESMHEATTIGGGWSDQVTSCIARRHGVKEVPVAGLYGWKLCEPGVMACPFNEAVYRQHALSDQPRALTFHYIEPQDMHRIHDIVLKSESDDEETAKTANFVATSTYEYNYNTARDIYIRMVDKERAVYDFPANETLQMY